MKFFLTTFFSVFSLVCIAQGKYGIVKSYAYQRPELPGTVPENDPHHGIDTLYLVYLEVKNSVKPAWKTAVVGHQQFNVIPTNIPSPVQPGVLANSSDTITLHTHKNNKMWQLTLEKAGVITTKNACFNNEIVLKGRWRKQRAIYRVKPIKVLQPMLTM